MQPGSGRPASTSIPLCVICTLILFTFAAMVLCASLIFAFLRLSDQYNNIQEMIDNLPSAEEVRKKIQESNTSDQHVLWKYSSVVTIYDQTVSNLSQRIFTQKEKTVETESTAASRGKYLIKSMNSSIREEFQKIYALKKPCEPIEKVKETVKLIDEKWTTQINALNHSFKIYNVWLKDLDEFDFSHPGNFLPDDYQYFHVRKDPAQPFDPNTLWNRGFWKDLSGKYNDCYIETGNNLGKKSLPNVDSTALTKKLSLAWEKVSSLPSNKLGDYFIKQIEGRGRIGIPTNYSPQMLPRPPAVIIDVWRVKIRQERRKAKVGQIWQ